MALEMDFRLQRGDFSLEAALSSREKVTGLVGPSGSGKTTILMSLIGILRPQSGYIRILGESELFCAERGISVPIEKRRLGVVFQENLLFPHLNVMDNLLFGYRRTPADKRRLEPDEIYDLLDLRRLLLRGASSLSGGEQRRVAIGRALLTSPSMLLLDEPLTGLDAALRDRILAYLLRLKSELSIPMVYVSHSFADITAICDQVALIDVEVDERHHKHSKISSLKKPHAAFADLSGVVRAGPIETIIEAVVERVDKTAGYAQVRSGPLELFVTDTSGSPGQKCFVTIGGEDIILSLGELPRLSSRNVWRGRVLDLESYQERTIVSVDVGRQIRTVLTGESARELELKPGLEVHVIVKANSLRAVMVGG
ncbi:MAG: molybdenum ABC transporter ATP-binding protein [Candidatus Glassbacteria bacterium]